jgi:preprotein translocase subunit SecG
MQAVLLVLHVFLGVGIIGLILIQHGKGADVGAAFGSGASGTLFGARGTASFLSRATAGLATVFFLNSMALAYLASHTEVRRSVVERVEIQAPASAPAESAPVPEAPAAPTAPADVPSVPAGGN